MKIVAAAALASLAMAWTPASAADLFGPAAPPLSDPPAVEVGSNWYIRGDLGVGIDNSPTVVPEAGLIPKLYSDIPGTGAIFDSAPPGDATNKAPAARGNNMTSQSTEVDVGLGYRVNDFVRLEATWNLWRGPGLGYTQKTLCPNTTAAESNTVNVTTSTTTGGVTTSTTTPTAIPVGYLWEPTPCNGVLGASQYNNLALASAYIDLGTWWGFTPYLGAGAGLNANTIYGSTKFYNTNDGSAFLGNTSATGGAPLQWVTLTSTNGGVNNTPVYTALTHQPGVVFGMQNWNRSFLQTKYSFAGALMAGVGYQFTQSATLDIGYRFLTTDFFGGLKNSDQQIHVGIRYMLN